MNLLQSIILGITQGLTEFLPVSSSGHLVLLQNIFGINEPELLFDICLHLGTLLAVVVVFMNEIRSILRTLWSLPGLLQQSKSPAELFEENEAVRIAVLIVAGTIPTAILGLLFHKITDQLFGSIWLVGCMLLVTGTLLWLTRRVQLKGRPLKRVTLKDALIIGVVQGLAILPGISRSGSTISAALFLGIDREVAGRFSFLLSIPAILGALVVGFESEAIRSNVSGVTILIGTATAGIVGIVALKVLLGLVKKGRLPFFAPYCWLIGMIAFVVGW